MKPSPHNERDHKKGLDELMESIRDAGFVGQIALRSHEDPTIVSGHGRIEALKRLGWTELPDEHIDWLDDLDDDQVERYRLNDNRTSDLSTWNKAKLKASVRRQELRGVDMSRFGFDFKSKVKPYGAERLKTDEYYNLHLCNRYDCGPTGYPMLEAVDIVPERFVGFNYALSMPEAEKAGAACHFFIDDYQFERLWTSPERYLGALRGFQCLIEPDFSVYLDMAEPVQRYNVYRAAVLAKYWTDHGLTVVPNITWAQPESYAWVWDSIPRGSTVAVSSVGVTKTAEDRAFFADGLAAAIERTKPSRLLWYGPAVDFKTDIEVVRFKSERFGR